MKVKIESGWQACLAEEFASDYFAQLTDFVRTEYQSGPCYPPGSQIFNAFDLCPFDRVRVVLLGQDPYHEPGQAEGLCFSVRDGVPFPPSLQNIFKEIQADVGHAIPASGSLRCWAAQGVLLLNATLTVRAHAAGSHQGHGWETFTDAAIRALAEEKENQRWLTYYSRKGIPAVLTDSQNGKGIGQVINKIEEVMKDKKEEMDSKGRTGRKIRVMILGIPNVGKSSFINRISKKTLAGVGNKPGVTKQKQWIRINEKVELLDTPGVLWPKFESNEVALHLAFTGTIKEDVLDRIEVAYELTKYLIKEYPEKLCQRYQLKEEYIKEIRNPIKQLKREIYLLKEYLKYYGVDLWIEGYVLFVNMNSPVESEYTVNDKSEIDDILHLRRNQVLTKNQIEKIMSILK